jgi:hypothetical protein
MNLETDTIGLTYQPTCVIYKGKRFETPVYLTTLQSWDYIVSILKSGEYKNS